MTSLVALLKRTGFWCSLGMTGLMLSVAILLFSVPVMAQGNFEVSTRPTPVPQGAQMRISVVTPAKMKQVKLVIPGYESLILNAVDDTLYNGKLVIPASMSPGTKRARVEITALSGEVLPMPFAFEVSAMMSGGIPNQVGNDVRGGGAMPEGVLATDGLPSIRMTNPLADLDLKVTNLENNVDALERDKARMRDEMERLKREQAAADQAKQEALAEQLKELAAQMAKNQAEQEAAKA
ncbi:MAG: hypothetical protein O3A01_08635, partial [bacterium]|nr:hypothetical protein [bacterium]